MAAKSRPPKSPGGRRIVRSEKRRATLFQPGVRQPGAGRKLGVKNTITEAQRKYLASTGLTPLQFLAMVYRDELYEDYVYEKVKTPTGETVVIPFPAPGSNKVIVKLEHRLSAASSASPYLHQRMPIAIEGTNKPLAIISADKLASMNTEDLQAVMKAMDILGLGAEMQGHGAPRFETTDLSDAEIVSEEAKP